MVQGFEREARTQTGLALRRTQCTRVQIRRPDQRPETVPEHHEALRNMHLFHPEECMRVLGAPLHPHGKPALVPARAAEGLEGVLQPQAAVVDPGVLSRQDEGATPRRLSKHGVVVRWELQHLHIAQTRMTRRIARWFPPGTETWPEFARRTAAQARDLRQAAGIPRWDETTWWRWAGHAGRLTACEPQRAGWLVHCCGAMHGGCAQCASATQPKVADLRRGCAEATGSSGTAARMPPCST